MRNTTRLGLTFGFGAGAVLAIACGGDGNNPQTGTAGAGGPPAVPPPAAAGADAGGAGGAPADYDPSFYLKFDADLSGLGVNQYGFSPNVGGTAGPAIIQDTKFLWDAAVGKSGGGIKMSVPFSVPFQQADVAWPVPGAVELTGY